MQCKGKWYEISVFGLNRFSVVFWNFSEFVPFSLVVSAIIRTFATNNILLVI